MGRETHTDPDEEPNQISKICHARSPPSACGPFNPGRPTGMALRTNSIFLKRENILAASDKDGVTARLAVQILRLNRFAPYF